MAVVISVYCVVVASLALLLVKDVGARFDSLGYKSFLLVPSTAVILVLVCRGLG